MRPVRKILILFTAFVLAQSVSAAAPTSADSSSIDLYETERVTQLKRISFEKARIADDFKDANSQFFNLVDSVTAFIERQPVSKDKRNLYLTRLQMFLTNVNRYYSDSYFKTGTYVAVLSYYPVMIEWDEKDDLTSNIKRYSDFTIKATRLIPNEVSAEGFLVDYMNDNPDDVFRYAEEFDDRKFALGVLEKATKLAPESAKRYFTSGNTVSGFLKTSRDPYVRRAIDIYNDYGLRSRAYLLLDQIVKGSLSMDAADSIGNHPDQMFDFQVGLCMKDDAPITYSSNKFIGQYCVDYMRKINSEAIAEGAGYSFESFKGKSPEEMFQLLTYGFKETSTKTFPGLFEILHKKAGGTVISNVMIANMDEEKLKEFVIFCYKNKVLDELLALVDDSKKEYLLGLTTYEKKETPTPPVKTFTPQSYAANNKPEDESLKNIVPAKPPKPVAPDTIALTQHLARPLPSTQTKTVVSPVPVPPKVKNDVAPVQKNVVSDAEAQPSAPAPVATTTAAKPNVSYPTATSVPSANVTSPPAVAQTPVTPPANTVAKAQVKTEPAKAPDTAPVSPIVPPAKPKDNPVFSSAVAKPEPVNIPAAAASPPPPVKKDIVPIPVVEVIEPVKIVLDDRVKAIMVLKKNILQTIQNIPAFINKDYAEEILLYAAQKEPDELFKKVSAFKGKVFCKKVLEECSINAPVSLKRYLYNPREPVNFILQYSTNPLVKKIFEINPELGYHSKPLLLLDDIAAGKLSAKEAVTISNDPVELFSAVVKIISRPKYIGRYSIDREMRDYSLRFVREINEKIATGAPQPFSSVEGFRSADLYFLMLYGRDEVFTSTFNGLFDRFIQKLPKDNGEAFLVSINYNQFRDFLSLCASYGTMEEFLTKFSTEEKKRLLQLYVAKLENEKDNLSSIVLIAEAISNLGDYTLLAILQESIKKEYERVTASKDEVGISIYGVLASMISGDVKVDGGWYRKIAQQFKISPATRLASTTLFGTGPVCAEQMYFYDDDDGRSSFISFMNSYKNQPAWGVEDRNSYVRIFSRQQKKVEILANKPGSVENGISAIDDYFKANNMVPSVIVHRGHSFHTESTLERMPVTTKLLFVGSCGGFYKIPIALENAPDAHIISTKQVGTKTVNDIMLFALNENIRAGKDIDWNEFWDKMRERLGNNQYFGDYVPPHKNLESIFIRAYYKILGV